MNGRHEVHELVGAYVIGALEGAERREFEVHLAECAACSAELRSFHPLVAGLAQALPQLDPPPGLRARVLAAVVRGGADVLPFATKPRASAAATLAWLAAAASLVAALGLGVYVTGLRDRMAALETRLAEAAERATSAGREVADARQELGAAQSTVAVLVAPDVTRVDLAGQGPVAPVAQGRAFFSRARGLVFTAANLPPVPPGRVYQLWYVTPQAVSAGLLAPDAQGRVLARFDVPASVARPVAFAVTLEPAGGVPQPTGDKYLVGLAPSGP